MSEQAKNDIAAVIMIALIVLSILAGMING